MSEFVQGALVAGGLTLAGVVVTLIGSFVIETRRELASYRVNLYEKRLAVHQKAYEWVQRLHVAYSGLPDREPHKVAEDANKELLDLTVNARAWWIASCLYLDRDSRAKFLSFTYLVINYDRGWKKDIFDYWGETIKAIEQGVGMKHIDTTRAAQEEAADG